MKLVCFGVFCGVLCCLCVVVGVFVGVGSCFAFASHQGDFKSVLPFPVVDRPCLVLVRHCRKKGFIVLTIIMNGFCCLTYKELFSYYCSCLKGEPPGTRSLQLAANKKMFHLSHCFCCSETRFTLFVVGVCLAF